MARTYRRGPRGRDINHYKSLGVIWHENEGFFCYDGTWKAYWEHTYTGADTYQKYVDTAISEYHREKRKHDVPRYVRKLDVKRQKRLHFEAIQAALASGDWDVALDRLQKNAVWAYW